MLDSYQSLKVPRPLFPVSVRTHEGVVSVAGQPSDLTISWTALKSSLKLPLLSPRNVEGGETRACHAAWTVDASVGKKNFYRVNCRLSECVWSRCSLTIFLISSTGTVKKSSSLRRDFVTLQRSCFSTPNTLFPFNKSGGWLFIDWLVFGHIDISIAAREWVRWLEFSTKQMCSPGEP